MEKFQLLSPCELTAVEHSHLLFHATPMVYYTLGSNHGHLKSVNIQNLSHLKCTKGSNNIGGFVPIDFCLIEYQIYVCINNMVGPKQTEAKHRKN